MSKRNQHKDVQRFAADEIVRAIDAVTKAGLTVYSVEITNSGSIKIETQPSQQHSSKAKTSPVNANVQPEIQKKKQVVSETLPQTGQTR